MKVWRIYMKNKYNIGDELMWLENNTSPFLTRYCKDVVFGKVINLYFEYEEMSYVYVMEIEKKVLEKDLFPMNMSKIKEYRLKRMKVEQEIGDLIIMADKLRNDLHGVVYK